MNRGWVIGLMVLAAGCRGAAGEEVSVRELAHAWTAPSETAVDDTTLLLPIGLAAHRDFIAVIDEAGPSIRVLSRNGELRRVIGRKGDGPGELRSPVAITILPDDRIAVADSRERRVAVFSVHGEVLESFSLDGGRLGSIAVDHRGHLHVDRRGALDGGRVAGSPTVLVLSPEREPVGAYGEFRTADHPIGNTLENEARLAAGSDGGMWVLYPYRGVLHHLDASGAVLTSVHLVVPEGRTTEGAYVEQLGPDPRSVGIVREPAAEDLASDEQGRAYVLMLHRQADGRDLAKVHVYGPNGEQQETLVLQHVAHRIAVSEGELLALRRSRAARALDVYELRRDN